MIYEYTYTDTNGIQATDGLISHSAGLNEIGVLRELVSHAVLNGELQWDESLSNDSDERERLLVLLGYSDFKLDN